jgi:hypothetical protein
LYGGLDHGRIDVDQLREVLARLPLPRWPDGRIVLAVDVSPWLRSDAACSAERLFCHVYGRAKSASQFIPGWPYSFVAALEMGRTSWTAPLDVVRLGPTDDATAVTAAQLRGVIERLIAAGQWRSGDPDVLIVVDAGYDVTRLAYVLRDLPSAWDRLHPRLTHRAAWLDHQGELPLIEGTVIRLKVEHLPGDRDAPPVWLWSSKTGATGADVDRCRQAFLRRFDLEHTYRLWKPDPRPDPAQTARPQAADRWTWQLIIAYTQLRLARRLTEDLRHPWKKPVSSGQLTPARVRRGFRNLRPALAQPTAAPKPARPGPGRPPGIPNRRPAPRYDVGKTVKRGRTLAALQQSGG